MKDHRSQPPERKPGWPEGDDDVINKYGTYEIQRTNGMENPYPMIAQGISPQEAQEQPTGQEGREDTLEPFAPYEATVTVPLVVIRRGTVPRPEDKPIGTMARGARVAVTNSLDGYAILANGTYVKEVYLERVKP